MTCDNEWEVIWDGSHSGDDRDLLVESARIPQKVHGPLARPNYQAAVLAVLEQADTWATLADIAAESGVELGLVKAQIYHLVGTQRVVRTAHAIRDSRSRTVRGYALPGRFVDASKSGWATDAA